ncbi:MAG: 30S ribosomal protein S9 [Patescibacteria group bacterium]|nr:MAG: 30S ribosomal protein S9 [Patescibacteria group bacterium]
MTEMKKTTIDKKSSTEQDFSKRKYLEALGKRKTSGARVRLYQGGKGVIIINDKSLQEYFPVAIDQTVIVQPLKAAAMDQSLDITVKVRGGGKHGQAEAVRHGIAMGLLALDKDLRAILKSNGWLTRDARKKERKKPGLRKARRAPQWSKR